MEGLRTGPYPDGAIIAEELLELYGTPAGGGKEGPGRFVGVMAKDSQKYSDTGVWGFGKYDSGSRVNAPRRRRPNSLLHLPHPRKEQGYVFTEYHNRWALQEADPSASVV
jgi:hypothetical protein